jgi:hypothetical protein
MATQPVRGEDMFDWFFFPNMLRHYIEPTEECYIDKGILLPNNAYTHKVKNPVTDQLEWYQSYSGSTGKECVRSLRTKEPPKKFIRLFQKLENSPEEKCFAPNGISITFSMYQKEIDTFRKVKAKENEPFHPAKNDESIIRQNPSLKPQKNEHPTLHQFPDFQQNAQQTAAPLFQGIPQAEHQHADYHPATQSAQMFIYYASDSAIAPVSK